MNESLLQETSRNADGDAVQTLDKESENLLAHSKEEELECAVCLQTCIHPVRLPCSHIFCFLCVKGVANQSKRCAMCRKEIPADFLENPILLQSIEEKKAEPEQYQWFYGGRNGWWQYDERTSKELESAYNSGERSCEVLVAGFLYTIDFDKMMQQRRNDPNRRRRIKRDLSSIPKKGVAGIKTNFSDASESVCDRATENQIDNNGANTQTDVAIDDTNPSSQSVNLPIVSANQSPSSVETELSQVHLLYSDLYREMPSAVSTTSNTRPRRRRLPVSHRPDTTSLQLYNFNGSLIRERDEGTTSCQSETNNDSFSDLSERITELEIRDNELALDENFHEIEEDGVLQFYSLDDSEELNVPSTEL